MIQLLFTLTNKIDLKQKYIACVVDFLATGEGVCFCICVCVCIGACGLCARNVKASITKEIKEH